MSRESKFQAWDIDSKRMKVTGMGINGGVLDGEGMVIVQFTGLKDIRHKDIYFDSSILKFQNSIFMLSLRDDEFGFICPRIIWIKNPREWGYYRFAYDKARSCEIIGNCFANPELLEVVR